MPHLLAAGLRQLPQPCPGGLSSVQHWHGALQQHRHLQVHAQDNTWSTEQYLVSHTVWELEHVLPWQQRNRASALSLRQDCVHLPAVHQSHEMHVLLQLGRHRQRGLRQIGCQWMHTWIEMPCQLQLKQYLHTWIGMTATSNRNSTCSCSWDGMQEAESASASTSCSPAARTLRTSAIVPSASATSSAVDAGGAAAAEAAGAAAGAGIASIVVKAA